MDNDSKYQFVLRCKQCKSKIISPNTHCRRCGISDSFFVKSEQTNQIKEICSTCSNEVKYQQLPKSCFNCGSSLSKEFWDQKNNDWIKREITFTSHKEAIWLVGDFFGDYVGDLISSNPNLEEEYLIGITRKYDVKITGGKLENYTFTDTPPQSGFK